MNEVPSLQDLSLIALAEWKYHHPDQDINFALVPSKLTNEIFKLAISPHFVTIKGENKSFFYTLAHDAHIVDLVHKIAPFLSKSPNQIQLKLNDEALRDYATLCQYGIKIGQPVTLSIAPRDSAHETILAKELERHFEAPSDEEEDTAPECNQQ